MNADIVHSSSRVANAKFRGHCGESGAMGSAARRQRGCPPIYMKWPVLALCRGQRGAVASGEGCNIPGRCCGSSREVEHRDYVAQKRPAMTSLGDSGRMAG